ncbi:hypothetical protein NIES2107_43910 [Nostoc carneum NIES-2107]|nr:hypothetical protein NIES2107_43910 [Nostoc carneum NIES-2107]
MRFLAKRNLQKVINLISLGLCLSAGSVLAQTLALPNNLIDFNSDEGKKLLIASKSREDFFPLSSQFVTQNNQA